MKISSLLPTLSPPSIPKPAISASKSSSLINQSRSSFLRPVNNSGCRLSLTPGNPKRKKGFICNSLFGLGVPEIAVVAGVAVLVFGPKQLPEIGRSIGKTVKGFQQAAKEFETELKKPEQPKSANEAIKAKTASGSSESQEKENVSLS